MWREIWFDAFLFVATSGVHNVFYETVTNQDSPSEAHRGVAE